MDASFRSLERAAKAAPDDPATLRALAASAARAGDARAAWRARGALARVTDDPDDWAATEPLARAPASPGRVQAVPGAGEVIAARRDGLLVRAREPGGEGIERLDLDGEVRWRLETDARPLPCGPDWLVCGREELELVDEAGRTIARAALEGGKRAGRPPGFTSSAQVTGDRAAVWHWTSSGQGARTVVDVGERFGAERAHLVLDNRGWGQDERGRVVAGRWTGARGAAVEVARLDGTDPGGAAPWSVPGVMPAGADPRGVITWSGEALVERDLRTGAPRWARALHARPWVHPARDHVLLRLPDGDLEVLARATGARVRVAPRGDALAYWVVGADLVLLRGARAGDGRALSLSVRDVASGVERWSAPLDAHVRPLRPVEADAWVPAQLVAGDGVLALTLVQDPVFRRGPALVIAEG